MWLDVGAQICPVRYQTKACSRAHSRLHTFMVYAYVCMQCWYSPLSMAQNLSVSIRKYSPCLLLIVAWVLQLLCWKYMCNGSSP